MNDIAAKECLHDTLINVIRKSVISRLSSFYDQKQNMEKFYSK